MSYRVKTNYDRGYVNAMDKVRVFIESNQKVMYVNTDEYKNAKNARSAYAEERSLEHFQLSRQHCTVRRGPFPRLFEQLLRLPHPAEQL